MLFRQPGKRNDHRGIGDLAALVEVNCRKFLTQNFLDALFLVETANPNLRFARMHFHIAIGTFVDEMSIGIAKSRRFRQCIEPDRCSSRIATEAQDCMPRTFGR